MLKINRRGRITNHKYGARATVVNGIRFASQREAQVYIEYLALLRVGEITNLVRQPKFKFPTGFSYVADFDITWRDGRREIVDVKGFETAVFKLKLKCFKHFYPDLVLVVRR